MLIVIYYMLKNHLIRAAAIFYIQISRLPFSSSHLTCPDAMS